ncbi:hypothetical protein U9M48_026452, partial [Paspalum notatum var. saurae]
MHETVLNQIDKYRKHCLWRGADFSRKGQAKAAWPRVCLPKESGDLGVLNLKIQNEAMLLKNFHKFFNRLDIPSKYLTVDTALSLEDSSMMFHLPLSAQAHRQYQEFLLKLESVILTDDLDEWMYRWGTKEFSTKKAYNLLIGSRQVHVSFGWLWKSFCQPKHKVFFWLILVDCLPTRDRLQRRRMDLPSYSCVMCSQGNLESSAHLFLHCPMLGSLGLLDTASDSLFEAWTSFKSQLNQPFFMELITIMAWSIWITRNNFVFRNLQPSLNACLFTFVEVLSLSALRAKASLRPALFL